MTAPSTSRRAVRVHSGGHGGPGRPLRTAALLALLPLLVSSLPAPARAQDPKARGQGEPGRVPGEGKPGEKKPADPGTEGKPVPPPAPATAEEKPRRKTEEEILLEAVGAEWKAGDVKSLAVRLPEKRKVSLRLPGSESGEYRSEQARAILDGYFSVRSFAKVELKSAREYTGTFEVEYTRTADRKQVRAQLLLVMGTEERRRVLVGARESP